MESLLHLPCAQIFHHSGTAVLEIEWRQGPSSAELREVLQAALRLAVQLRSRAWIGNLQHLGPLTPDDYRWLDEEWLPQLAAATTVNALALVLPAIRAVGPSNAAAQRLKTSAPLYTRYFATVQEARHWASRLP